MRLYKPKSDTPATRERWVNFLLERNAVEEMIQHFKSNSPISKRFSPGHPELSKSPRAFSYLGAAKLRTPLAKLRSGIPLDVDVTIENNSNTHWENTSSTFINASYHWLDENGSPFQYDGMRTPLPTVIAVGEAVPLKLKVIPPSYPGSYQLQLTLVHEGVCWFEERGFNATLNPIEIEWCLPASTDRVLEEINYLKGILAEGKRA
jgi:hypothetical protein